MPTLLRMMVLAGLLISAGACGDTPTEPGAALPDAAARYNEVQGCVVGGICVLPPISSGGGSGWCGPRMGDCGDGEWGTCITGAPGTSDPEMGYLSSCPGGDGGGGGGPWGGGGGSTPPPPSSDPPPADTCYTGEPMVDDPDVQGQFDVLWQQSVQQGVEVGGWIVRDGTDNYRLIPFHNAVYTPCGVDIYEAPPANLVAIFHTHPWQFGQSRMCDGAYALYTGTPSPEDVQALQQLGLSTGYFIDYIGVARYTATGGEKATNFGRCGY